MNQGKAVSEIRERSFEGPRRRCAFCDAPFSDAMIAWLGPERPCACCDGGIAGHWPIAGAPVEKPAHDLACHACGKVLYLAPKD